MMDHEFTLLFSEAYAGRQFEDLAAFLSNERLGLNRETRSDYYHRRNAEIRREAERILHGGKISSKDVTMRDCFARLTQDLRLPREEVDLLRTLVFGDAV